jgi:hypothetical protein
MPEISMVKKIYKWVPFINRPVGSPKSQWEHDVRSDLRKIKFLECTQDVLDRSKWKACVEKAKTL